jgi:hypothetical protein
MASSAEPDLPGQAAFELFPVPLGAYDFHPSLEVGTQVDRLTALLAEVGGYAVPWPTPMGDRGADEVNARLLAWAKPDQPGDTLLYWVGHGWSDGRDASLAHARSPVAVRAMGVLPFQLSDAICSRQATADSRWAIVAIDTCWSSRFVDLIDAAIATDAHGADAVLLVGVSGDGATALGRFPNALEACLRESFRSDQVIDLWKLAGELDRKLPSGVVIARKLGNAALSRRDPPVASSLAVPLDVLHEVEQLLSSLGDVERRHFLSRAQDADGGELSWYFVGRRNENLRIVNWLRAQRAGMLVVTGEPGSGKSALLGHVLINSLPEVRGFLTNSGIVPSVPPNALPPSYVFDDIIHLAGMTIPMLVRRIALAASVHGDEAADGLDSQDSTNIDWLEEVLRRRVSSLTLMLDALDEAADPLMLARTVIARVAALPGIRILIACRPSVGVDSAGYDPSNLNMLDALKVRGRARATRTLWVKRDRRAVETYSRSRLQAIASAESAPRAVRDMYRAAGPLASLIADHAQDFLFARLAVQQLLRHPELSSDTGKEEFTRLLQGGHRDLFAQAVRELTAVNPVFHALLEALAISRGRGLPIVDGIWVTVASALTADSITDDDVSLLLGEAMAFITVDSEAGQTVYRLAHRTFMEYLLEGDRELP